MKRIVTVLLLVSLIAAFGYAGGWGYAGSAAGEGAYGHGIGGGGEE